MRHLSFATPSRGTYSVCFLVPVIQKQMILDAYVTPHGLNPDEILVLDLHQSPTKKKTPKAEMKAYVVEQLQETLDDMHVQYIVCTDSEYFKLLTNSAKADAKVGYVLDSIFGNQKVVYVPNYRQIFYDPEPVKEKITRGLKALTDYRSGAYTPPGTGIIDFAAYPMDPASIKDWLATLLTYPVLSCDIETFSLKPFNAGIGTIAFAWEAGSGIAFPVDLSEHSHEIRLMLLNFFRRYTGKLIFHKIEFDVGVLIYQLFMADIIDTAGLLEGLRVMMRDWDCTRIISYLATNSCAGNNLSLKDQSQEYAGHYALTDIHDIRSIPLAQLLEYNLVDCFSTLYVHAKHWPTLVADNQEQTYRTVFQPAMFDIIQMQLTGMPVDMARVLEIEPILQADSTAAVDTIMSLPIVQHFICDLNRKWVDKRNSELKVKRVSLLDAKETFNPNSGPQLQELLFEHCKLPVIALTAGKQFATDKKTLQSLVNHTKDPEVIQLLNALIDYGAVAKILSSVIPALKSAVRGPDGWHYLFGNFNLGGTLSGRLSSSDPNLQNLPSSGTRYAKLIKSCFVAAPGWLFVGVDFDSLEDRISALTTKDPNKLKVYEDGFDGHSLRAYSYFSKLMSNIDPDNVDSINSIAKIYPDLRQLSKVPTFLLTYDGTWMGIVEQCALNQQEAQEIERSYHELYVVSDQWKKARMDQAAIDGYVTVAFGLRVRTPLLSQSIRGISKTPFEVEAEARSAGNALGQSWCLLNSRAGSEFLGKVRESKHRYNIRPCAQIHDAQYFMIRDDLEVLHYTNTHLIEAVRWQNDPEIQHAQVTLGGKLCVYWPDWSQELKIPNDINSREINRVLHEQLNELGAKKAA